MDKLANSNFINKMNKDALMDDILLDIVTPFDENCDNIPLITDVPEDDG